MKSARPRQGRRKPSLTIRLFNLRFAFETGDMGLSSYIASLRRLLKGVDTTTQQGKEIFLEITNLIDESH